MQVKHSKHFTLVKGLVKTALKAAFTAPELPCKGRIKSCTSRASKGAQTQTKAVLFASCAPSNVDSIALNKLNVCS